MLNCVIVGLGGCLGSVLRYLLGLIPLREGTIFPWKTLCINLLGSFLIGLVAALMVRRPDFDPRLALFLKVGICGGFTTFSSFALETVQLLQGNHPAAAAAYLVLSILCSVCLIMLAQALVK